MSGNRKPFHISNARMLKAANAIQETANKFRSPFHAKKFRDGLEEAAIKIRSPFSVGEFREGIEGIRKQLQSSNDVEQSVINEFDDPPARQPRAIEGDTKKSYLHVRCLRESKRGWNKTSKQLGVTLSFLIVELLERNERDYTAELRRLGLNGSSLTKEQRDEIRGKLLGKLLGD